VAPATTLHVDNAGDVITELSVKHRPGQRRGNVHAARERRTTWTLTAAPPSCHRQTTGHLLTATARQRAQWRARATTRDGCHGRQRLCRRAGNDTLNVTSTSIDRIRWRAATGRYRGRQRHGRQRRAGVSNGIPDRHGLIKSGNDLVLDLGSGESVTLRNWYAGVRNVRHAEDHRDAAWVPGQTGTPTVVETLSLVTLASQFDAARAADPLLTRWPLSSPRSLWWRARQAITRKRLSRELRRRCGTPARRIGAKSTLRTATLEPSDLVLEARSLRNLQALMKVWEPTTAAESKASGG